MVKRKKKNYKTLKFEYIVNRIFVNNTNFKKIFL